MLQPWMLLLLPLYGLCSCSDILVFYPGRSGSLLRGFSQLFLELSRRGHLVTIVTSNQLPISPKHNITQVIMGFSFNPNIVKELRTTKSLLSHVIYTVDFSLSDCEELFNDKSFKSFMNSNRTYDLFIGAPTYFLECTIAVAEQLNLPVVNIFSNRLSIQASHILGNIHPYSYVADFNMPFGNHMNFWQRSKNTLFGFAYSLLLSYYYLPRMSQTVEKHFPHLPPLQEMLKRIDVTLLNTNLAVHPAQPLPPNLIPVGGLSILHNTKLPEDLEEWMNYSKDGVILFSMGSNINTTTLDPDVLRVIVAVFSRLKQRVLMKWELDHMVDQPENIRLEKWIPQASVLGHPHCRLMVTHGGLHTWMEAVYHRVPLLGILPMFLDQFHNLAEIEHRQHGLYFAGPWSEHSFQDAIHKVLFNPRYKEEVQKSSLLLRDQPMGSLQKAVYWTEYVIRHRGAKHLKPRASNMHFCQLMLLDVIAVLILAVAIGTVMVYFLFRCAKSVCLNSINQHFLSTKKFKLH